VLGPLLVAVQVLQALTWRTRRDLQTALLVALGLLVLGGSYAPDTVVGLPLLAGWASALVAGLLLRRGTQPAAGARPVVAATALALALGVAAFLLVPVPDDRALRSRLTAAAQAVQPSARGAVFTGDRMDLHTRGELSDTPLVEVAADSPTLWRSGVWSTWDGRAWTSPERGSTGVPGPPYVLPGVPGAPRTDLVRPLTADPTLWAPGQVSSLDSPAGRVSSDGLGTLRRSWSGPYRITTAVPDLDPARLRAAAGPGDPDPRWQQLPDALPGRVRDLARELTATAPSRYDAVLAVERWLAANASYRLDSPVPGPREDAVDRFLFVDRSGFCEQFAAAEAVLLRAAGIPARVATGLAYGAPGDPGLRTYREKDLHAWVEVSYEGVGWVSSDPTAGAASAEAGGSLRVRVGAQLSAALRSAESVPGGRPAIAAALLAAVVAAGVAAHARRRRPRTRRTAPPEDVAVGPALAAFLRLDARLGDRGRRHAESLAELRDRVGLPAGALSVVERECYGPAPPDARSAVEVLDRLHLPTVAGGGEA
jgi:transglutaminase-like putative cysteine protease